MFDGPAAATDVMQRHRYELREGAVMVEARLLAEIGEFRVGDPVNVNGPIGTVRAAESEPGQAVSRLIVELRSDPAG